MISKVVKGIDTEYYVYSGMNRVRKITHFGVTGGVRETIYLGGCELKRISQASGTQILKCWDSHIMDDTSRIAIVNTWEQDSLARETDLPVTKGGPSVTKIRYQYGNHLGSAALELDHSGTFVMMDMRRGMALNDIDDFASSLKNSNNLSSKIAAAPNLTAGKGATNKNPNKVTPKKTSFKNNGSKVNIDLMPPGDEFAQKTYWKHYITE